MQKNTAGQKIGAQLVSATDGSAFTGSVTVYVCGDAGTQAVGSVSSGACTHEGNGYHTYAPAQAETNYDLIAFTFIGTGAIPTTVQVSTAMDANLVKILGTATSSPATAGILDVNVKNMNNVAATSITTINANQGTTQPINFTGTGATAYAKSDMVDIAGAAVSTSTAQIGVNVVNFGGSAGTFASGRPEVNVSHFGGSAGTFASGRPETNTTHIAGSAVSTSSAQIGVNIVNAAGTAWASGAITAAAIADGAIDRATFAADTGMQSTRSSTAQAGAAGTITLDASASATTDFYKGMCIYLTGGTGAGQARVCTAYNGSTKVATITPNWATNPDNTSTFAVMETAASDLRTIGGTAVSTSSAQLGVNVVQAGATAWGSGAITAASIASNAITSAKIATDAIGAAQIAADAIGASELAADAVTEIWAGSTAPSAATTAAAVWDLDATAHQTQGTFGQAIGDPAADTNSIFKAVVTDATGATVGVDVVAVKAETASIQSDTNDLQTQIGTAGAGLTAINLPDQTMNITGDITGSLSGSVGSVTGNVGGNVAGSVGSVTGNVGGNVTGSVGSVASGGITAASIATNAIDADALAADAVTEIWAGSTAPTAATIADAIWDEDATAHQTQGTFGQAIGDPGADTDTIFGLVNTNLDAAVSSRLAPTTAGRTLDVSATGEAGVDWANIGSPTTTVNLSGTTVKTATDVETDTQDIQSRLPAALTGAGNIKADALAISGDTTAADNAESFFDGTGYAGTNNVIPSVTTVTGNVNGNVGGNVTGSVGSVATGGITASSIAADAIGASELAADAVAEIQSGLATSSALSTAQSDITAIKTKTDQFAFGTANRVNAQVYGVETAAITAGSIATDAIGAAELAADAVTAIQSGLATSSALSTAQTDITAIKGYVDTEVAAVKAVTDKLDTALELDGSVYRYTTNALEQGPGGSAPTAAAVADAVWDEVLADHLTSGTTGNALSSAGSAGDPWGTSLPGAYGAGTAGKIIGDNINATVSSRSSHSAADVWAVGTRTLTSFGTLVADIATAVWAAASRTLSAFGFTVDTNANSTETAIKAKTDSLTFTVSGQVDSNIQSVNDTEVAGTGANNDKWGPA